MEQDDLYERVVSYLVSDFEIDPDRVAPDANLFLDLELDSIDALDWFIKMETELHIRLVEEELRSVRTVSDVVDYARRNQL